MPDRPRYYLTTAIAYPNNKPGLHTLYEVIGADVIARWHRMKGDDTRFLTGTDEHSVNIAQRADGARPGHARRSSTRWSSCSRTPRTRCSSRPTGSSGRRIPTTAAPARRWSAGPTRTATSTSASTRAGTARTRASRRRPTCTRPPDGMRCPNHPNVELQWLTERNWFFRLSAYRDRLLAHFEAHPEWVQPEYRKNEMLAFLRERPRGHLDQPRDLPLGHPVPDRRERRDRRARGRLVGSRGGRDLRLVRRAHQLHHRRGLPRRPGGVRASGGRPTST